MKKGYRMKTRIMILVSALAVCLNFLGSAALAQEETGSEDAMIAAGMGHDSADQVAVARVNGVDITMSAMMDKVMEIAQKKTGSRQINDLVAEGIRKDAIEQLVTEELAYQQASKLVTVSDQEIQEQLTAMQENMGGAEAFAAALKTRNSSVEAVEKQIRRFLAVRKAIKQEVDDKVVVTDEEIKAAYSNAKDKYFVQREKVQITDIIFFLDPSSAESMKKVIDLQKKIGEEPDKDPTKLANDGSYLVRQNIKVNASNHKLLYEAAKQLGEYEVSDPLNVDGTMHLVQLTGFQPEVTKSVDEVIPYLRNELKNRRKWELMEKWRTSLTEGSKVEIFEIEMD